MENNMIGHNSGDPAAMVRDDLDERGRPLARLAATLTATPAPDAILDRAEAGIAAERVKNITGAIKDIEALHKAAKAPHLAAGKACDAWKDDISRDLLRRKQELLAVLAEFQRAEAEAERTRREVEAANARAYAERLAAQEHPAAARAADLAATMETHVDATDAGRVRSRTGALSSLRSVWDFRVVDLAAVPRQYLTIDEIAVRAAIKGGARSIPGIEIFERQSAVVR